MEENIVEKFYLNVKKLKLYVIGEDRKGQKVKINIYGDFKGVFAPVLANLGKIDKDFWHGVVANIEGKITNIKIGNKRKINEDS